MANYAYYTTELEPNEEVLEVWSRFFEYAVFGSDDQESTLKNNLLREVYIQDHDEYGNNYAHAFRGMGDMLQRWWDNAVLSSLWHAQGPKRLVMEGANNEEPILMTPTQEAWLQSPLGRPGKHGTFKNLVFSWNLKSCLKHHHRTPRSKGANWYAHMEDVAHGFEAWYNDQGTFNLKPMTLAMIACCDPTATLMACMEHVAKLKKEDQKRIWTQAFAHEHANMLLAMLSLGYRLPDKETLQEELRTHAWVQGRYPAVDQKIEQWMNSYDHLAIQEKQIEHEDAFRP